MLPEPNYHSTTTTPRPQGSGTQPYNDLGATDAAWQLMQQYARERPDMVALWAFGVGFILGWKLKPW